MYVIEEVIDDGFVDLTLSKKELTITIEI